MSRCGINATSAMAFCSARSVVAATTWPTNQSRKRRLGLHHAAADEVRVRVGEVRGQREQPAQRHGLLAEHLEGELVPLRREAAHRLRRLPDRQGGQVVTGVAGQPVGQQVLHDAGERRVQLFGRELTLPFTVIYLHEVRGMGLDVAGLLMAWIFAVGFVIVTGPGGAAVDRFGARLVTLVACLVHMVGVAILAFADTVPKAIGSCSPSSARSSGTAR